MKRGKIKIKNNLMKKRLTLFIIAFIIGLFLSNYALAEEFGILSETYIDPGLKLNGDSKLQWYFNIATNDDFQDKREGRRSLIGYALINMRFGFGIIYDSDQDDIADPKDMSAYSNGALKFWVKTETSLRVGIKDEGGTESWVDLSDFGLSSDNQWRFISIPFRNFSNIDFSQITEIFMVANKGIPATGMRTFHFDNVRYDTNETGALLNSVTLSPSTWKMPQGLPKAFIAKGYDSNTNTVDVYPAWSNSGITGTFSSTFNTNEGPIVIFTPTSSSGSGSLTAAYNNISGSANIQVENIIWNDFFNLLIDQGLCGGLGKYDSDDGDADGDGMENNSIDIETVDNVYPSGYKRSIKAAYSITNTGWAGLFIQEGQLSDLTSTKDISSFQDGYLNFWIKTPVDLQIGLRSSNMPEGGEFSKVNLSEYNIPADNNWHQVYIALDDFKIWDNRLDFTKIKVFFNIAVIGKEVSNYSDTFYLSNVKYIRRKETTPSVSVNIKKRSDNQIEPAGEITFSSAQLEGGWEIADQYLEVSYENANPSWGVQIYTNNLGSNASPKYKKDPTKFLDQQPAGLIGEGDGYPALPMTWLALDEVNQNVPVPAEIQNGTPGTPSFYIYFKSDTSGKWGQEDARGEWSWLKDLGSTKWDDKDSDGILDIAGSYGDPNYEIVSNFPLTGDEYSTFIGSSGIGTGWGSLEAGTRVYILNPQSPVVLYLAAKFREAKMLQKYKTNTLTLELYHY